MHAAPPPLRLQAKGEVRVLNNGAGVPVEVHKTEGMYVPELIFGHLLTSSNYNDSEKKVTGGRNGYGAKLANIFSSKFTVETCDGKRKRRYKQVFKKNMTHKGEPVITDCKATDNWTCISFQPDLERFGMEELEEDTGEEQQTYNDRLLFRESYSCGGVQQRSLLRTLPPPPCPPAAAATLACLPAPPAPKARGLTRCAPWLPPSLPPSLQWR